MFRRSDRLSAGVRLGCWGLCAAWLSAALSGAAEGGSGTGTAAPARVVPVVTTPAQQRVFEERVAVQGNVEAKTAALVPARIPGTLTALHVDEGDVVVAGQTALFATDDVNLQNALEISRLDLAVAGCGVREKQANLDREKANLERWRKDYERQKRLFEIDRIGTVDKVEEAESEYKQGLASVAHAASLVALAEAQQHQATAAVSIATKNLSDATVVAPISGVVSQRFQDRGEMGSPAKPVFRIVDLTRLEVSAYLPAQHYDAIAVGQTKASLRVDACDLGERVVSYRAPVIDEQLRVFEIKCLLADPPAVVAPGAMASVTVVLRREEGLGVPKESITQRDGKTVLFRLEGHTARQTDVECGLETDGWVQVRAAALAAGTPVVTMGQFLLNDGVRVEVRAGAATTAAPAASTDARAGADARLPVPVQPEREN